MKPRSGIELLERSVFLVRDAGLASICIYLVGALPWAVGLLFYFADMTYNARSNSHLAEYALGMALLFIWKNCWQAVYSNALYDRLTGERRPWRRERWMRLALITCAGQPLSILVLPIAMLVTLPYAQALAFFKNLQLFAGIDGRHPEREAWRLSLTDGRQNWMGLAIAALAWLVAFLNIVVLLAGLPQIAKTFLGIESELARLGARIVSPVLLLASGLVTYLVFDPLLDAFYTIRCFHGKAVTTGEDLRIDFRRAVAVFVLAALTLSATVGCVAAQTATNHERLEKSIEKVLERDEFSWRAPKEGKNPAWLDSINRMWKEFTREVSKFLEWLFSRKPDVRESAGGTPDRSTLQIMLYASTAVFLLGLGCILYWQWTLTRTPVQIAAAVPVVTKVDLKDEAVTADQLPEAEWLALASSEAASGEFRLATRALYLAGLNHLMHRDLVSIRKWKSGLEYSRELERRAKAAPRIPPVFAECLETFERGWYGFDCVDGEVYQRMLVRIEEMRSLHV